MNRASLVKIMKNFADNDTIVFATAAMNATNSQLIASLKPTIDYSNDNYIIIDKSTEEKQLVYYIPYENILMIMKG